MFLFSDPVFRVQDLVWNYSCLPLEKNTGNYKIIVRINNKEVFIVHFREIMGKLYIF